MVKKIKKDPVLSFKKGFKLHKWSSNASELQHINSYRNQELRYVKPVLKRDSNETNILGLGLMKEKVALPVVISFLKDTKVTKRNILIDLASIYDHVSLISSVYLISKLCTERFVR